MRSFNKYLSSKGYATITIRQHEYNISFFLDWLDKQAINIASCGYYEIIQFIDNPDSSYLNMNKNGINRILTSI